MTHAMTTMLKYEGYKDSGFKPIGDIPEHWEAYPLCAKAVLKSISNKENEELLSVYLDKGVIRFSDVKAKRTNVTSQDLSNYQLVEPGDFVLNNQQAWRGSVGVSKYKGIVSPAYLILELSKDINPNYANYLFRDSSMVSHYLMNSKGVGTIQRNLYWPSFKRSSLFLPPLQEQEAIAKLLDEKTAQIDEAIGIKERQIALLKERKQIIIQNAVTKGLNPSAPMKDSGVDWIGDIPSHWKVEKLFGLCRFVRGNSAFAKDELLSNGKYAALQYGKTYQLDEVDNSYEFYVNEEFYKESQIVNFGDVIVISTSETIEDLGHSAIYTRDDVGLIGGEQLLIKPNSDLLDHYYIYYSTKVFSKELRKYATGIKVFRFNINNLKTIYTAVPPKEEQAEIASYIKDSLKQVDKAIDLQQAQINKLKEYKASLINSAVTGKIKVI